MAGGNSTISSSSKITCDTHLVSSFHESMEGKIWLVNALQLAGAILAGLIVGIGIYGQRYRHHRFTRFIFLGATTLFLAIISTVVSMGSNAYAQTRVISTTRTSINWLHSADQYLHTRSWL